MEKCCSFSQIEFFHTLQNRDRSVIETSLIEMILEEKGAMLRLLCLVEKRVPLYYCGDITYVKFDYVRRF